MAKNTELVTIEEDGSNSPYLPAVRSGDVDIAKLVADNVGNSGINRFSLNRIKIPTGGGVGWTIPTLDGPEVTSTLTGVAVWWTPMRAFWETSLGDDATPSNTPPDCSSQDGVTGQGNPGGNCAMCPFNEYGSRGGGRRGKACKEIRALFLLREGMLLPDFVSLPPTSIKPLQDYFLQLVSAGIPYHRAVTTLTLEQSRNADNIVYSRIVPKLARRIAPGEASVFDTYRASLKPVLEGVVLTADDVN